MSEPNIYDERTYRGVSEDIPAGQDTANLRNRLWAEKRELEKRLAEINVQLAALAG